jgi:inositol phosphorylceramide mannosyltransferase catalytic subunit
MSDCNLEIPKNIFQTHKSLSYVNSSSSYRNCINSWTKHKNSYNYFFYNDQMCDDFIKNNFDDVVYQAYSRLPMAVMKADLWRYCVIYIYGGIYADADAMCLVDPDLFTLPKTLLVGGPENETHLSQWFFAAPKNSPILKTIIDLSVKRILEIPEIKGEHIIHHLTGPGCFTDGIEEFLKSNEKPMFNDKTLYDSYRNDTMCIFNEKTYRTKIIHHFFAGIKPGGWIQERNSKLM